MTQPVLFRRDRKRATRDGRERWIALPACVAGEAGERKGRDAAAFGPFQPTPPRRGENERIVRARVKAGYEQALKLRAFLLEHKDFFTRVDAEERES
jgi:hypothetical protein